MSDSVVPPGWWSERSWSPADGASVGGQGTAEHSASAAAGAWERPGSSATVALVLTASVFWATATLAEWSGRGSVRDAARHLDRFPSVIVDTKERLYLTSPP